jgi:hypothetical protein
MAFTSFPKWFLWYYPKLAILYAISTKKSIYFGLILPYIYAKEGAFVDGI